MHSTQTSSASEFFTVICTFTYKKRILKEELSAKKVSKVIKPKYNHRQKLHYFVLGNNDSEKRYLSFWTPTFLKAIFIIASQKELHFRDLKKLFFLPWISGNAFDQIYNILILFHQPKYRLLDAISSQVNIFLFRIILYRPAWVNKRH